MGKKPIEVIAKYEDPRHISCYRCDYCYTIFTMESNDDWELCPVCKHMADRITKARFNLIKWIRRKQMHGDIADECKPNPTLGTINRESDAFPIKVKVGR